MNIITNPPKSTWNEILQRPTQTVDDIENTVNQIFGEVSQKGDTAVLKYTSLFDGVNLETMLVSTSEIEAAEKEVSDELKQAIQ